MHRTRAPILLALLLALACAVALLPGPASASPEAAPAAICAVQTPGPVIDLASASGIETTAIEATLVRAAHVRSSWAEDTYTYSKGTGCIAWGFADTPRPVLRL